MRAQTDASSFWPIAILIDCSSASLNDVFLSSRGHTVCVIAAGFCLCGIPHTVGQHIHQHAWRSRVSHYMWTLKSVFLLFWTCKACQFLRYLPWGSAYPSSSCSTGLWNDKITPGFLAVTHFSVLAEQRALVCCMLTLSFVCWLGNFTMNTTMCIGAKCFPTF